MQTLLRQTYIDNEASYDVIKGFIVEAAGLNPPLQHIDIDLLTKSTESGISDDFNAEDLLPFLAEIASQFTFKSYDYGMLAGRLEMLHLYKHTPDTFKKAMNSIKHLLNEEFLLKVNSYDYDKLINIKDDFSYDIIGVKTLKRSYLLKNSKDKFV